MKTQPSKAKINSFFFINKEAANLSIELRRKLMLNTHMIIKQQFGFYSQLISQFLSKKYSHMYIQLFVFVSGIVGLFWSYHHYSKLKELDIQDHPKGSKQGMKEPLNPGDPSVQQIGAIIAEGASAFITEQYKICSLFILFMGAIIFFFVDQGKSWFTTIAFIIGASTSMFCGGFSMKIATFSNYRTTICAQQSLGKAFKTAYRAGCIMGFTLVSISIMVLMVLIMIYKNLLEIEDQSTEETYYEQTFEAIAGYGLGGSTVAMFARVGGGIFTKAADLGSDLVGKVESDLPEDSPKNPATIADNVGDNVGDVAGMGADLFGSFAESTCAALVIACSSISDKQGVYHFWDFVFVLAIPATGIFLSLLTSYIITQREDIEKDDEVDTALNNQLVFSTILLIPGIYIISWLGVNDFKMLHNNKTVTEHNHLDVTGCILSGLIAGMLIGYVTKVMTSYAYRPVIELSEACENGAATNVIYGLALGYLSTIIPVILLCLVCYFSHSSLGYYGVALAALGMLSNLPICLAIDGYGPISDNAGGIAEMAELPPEVRKKTDVLDSAGNTTAAVGKGFAIGSATLVGLALYGAFLHSSYMLGSLVEGEMSFDDPMIFTSLLFGAMLPYAFSALTMKSVGQAAQGMIAEVRKQIKDEPKILTGEVRPDYTSCVKVSTQSALKQMILPGLLVLVTPFLLGVFFGPKALLGFLPGAIVSGVQMAISASNTGGAWDNAKKYIEAGKMTINGVKVVKGSDIHKAAVIGDTVGDPLKDTSGPSLNILIKLMAILSLVFCRFFAS